MKKIGIFFISILFFFHGSLLALSTDPKEFVTELVNDAIGKLADKNISKEDKAVYIEKIALDNVDIKALSLYALGELRKSTDKNNIENYSSY